MRRALPVLLPLALLGGCAGYAADYLRPKAGIMAPQLPRYQLTGPQGECVGARLATTLSVGQLGVLARAAEAVPPTHFGGTALTSANLVYVARQLDDDTVGERVAAAVESCANAGSATPASSGAPGTPAQTSGPVQSTTAAVVTAATAADTSRAGSVWLNLGAATSGQSIAVDGLSIEESGTIRQAWFRLTNPGETRPGPRSYLLRIDCATRTLNSMALRRHRADWSVEDEDRHGENGEGAAPIAGGTVMEIAFLALCT